MHNATVSKYLAVVMRAACRTAANAHPRERELPHIHPTKKVDVGPDLHPSDVYRHRGKSEAQSLQTDDMHLHSTTMSSSSAGCYLSRRVLRSEGPAALGPAAGALLPWGRLHRTEDQGCDHPA